MHVSFLLTSFSVTTEAVMEAAGGSSYSIFGTIVSPFFFHYCHHLGKKLTLQSDYAVISNPMFKTNLVYWRKWRCSC